MTQLYISVHPVSRRLEWRGWGGRLLTCPASMFSAERFNGAFHGIAITIMSRIDCSDVFFVAVEL